MRLSVGFGCVDSCWTFGFRSAISASIAGEHPGKSVVTLWDDYVRVGIPFFLGLLTGMLILRMASC